MSRGLRVAILVAGLLLFAWLILRVGPAALLADARRAGWAIVPILLVHGVVYAGFAAAWWITLDGAPGRPSLARLYAITISGFALNYLTPFVNLGGEPYKAAAVSAAVGPRRAAGSVVAYNVVHTLSHVLVWLLAITVVLAVIRCSPLVTATLAATGAALLALLGLLLGARRTGLLVPILAVLRRVPFAGRLRAAVEARRHALEQVDAHILDFFRVRPGRLALAVGVDMLSRAFSFLEFWLIFQAVGRPESLGTAYLLGAFSTLILNILFFVPFEMGSREGGIYLLFHLFGLDPALAVFTVIVNRLREIVWIGSGLGLIALSARRASRRVATGEVRAESEGVSGPAA